MNHKLNNIVSRENSKLPNKIYNKYIARPDIQGDLLVYYDLVYEYVSNGIALYDYYIFLNYVELGYDNGLQNK
jgi:hypothetical protein